MKANNAYLGIGQPSKGLVIALWVAQWMLALMFVMAGCMKLGTSMEELAKQIPWVAEVPSAFVRFVGFTDLLCAMGILVPALTRIKPALVPVAALGIALTMVLAIVFHLSRGEASVIGLNVVIAALALFVAWGRAKKAPILSK